MPARLASFAVSENRFERVLIAIMAAGFASLLVAVAAVGWVTKRNGEHTFWVNHTYRVELTAASARQQMEQAESVRRGDLIASSPYFGPAFAEAADRLPATLGQIAFLTRDNPRQRANLSRLRAMVAAQIVRERTTFALIAAGRRDEARRRYQDEVAARPVTAIRALFDAVSAEERRLLLIRDRDQQTSIRTFYAVLMMAGVLLAVVAVLSLLIVMRFTRDLTRSRNQQRELNEGLEGVVAERTADLTRANEEIQRFAYIVSHDLRSPLVNVMGFTAELETATRHLATLVDAARERCPEIVTEDAGLAVHEDMPEAIGFIRSSTQKMDRLINAILKLSREGRRVITAEPLDLARIVGGVRDSIRHRLDETGTELSIGEPMPALVGDRLAVEQILSNLIENSVKYLQPGRPGKIAVRARATGGRVVIEVADNGRGIDPRDHSRVFDLFRRSGAQDQPGEGIGLAHVRALAYRLGGIVDMTSELGQGSTFRVTLPQDFAEQDRSR